MKRFLPLLAIVLTALFGNAQLPITADFKNHLVLNGTSNYVNIPANAAMAFPRNATIEAFVRTDNATLTGSDIIFINCIEPDSWGILLQLNSGQPSVDVVIANVQHDLTSPRKIAPNQTYHIAGVRKNDSLYLYVNGVLDAARLIPSGDLRYSAGSLSRIGRAQLFQNLYFGGCLDELRVWNYARTQTEIAAQKDSTLAGNESGLVLYYQMNETTTGQNSSVKNSALATGNALNGTTIGDATSPYFSNVCPSVYCNSLVFNSLPPATVRQRNSYCFDGVWKNYYDSSNTANVLVSIDENSQSLGDVVVDEYLDPTSGSAGFDRYMRRHYVVKPTLATTNTKKIRLFYSNADFLNLQAAVPTLSSASQLVVTKYKGASEDSVYAPSGGTTTFIPSSQIVRGTAFGQPYLELPVTDFGEFWIHASGFTLPLTFLHFTAVRNGNEVVLNWATENEIDVHSFDVERSSDGRNFFVVGSRRAANQPSNTYSLNDFVGGDAPKKMYYRIKQTDNNGSVKYGSTISVNFSKRISVTVSPNPAKNLVGVSAFGITGLRLLSLDGKVIKSWKPSANQHYSISDVTDGFYLLEVVTGEASQIEKLMIHR